MGYFADPLLTQKVIDRKKEKVFGFIPNTKTKHFWRTAAAFRYIVKDGGARSEIITVPAGFETDFASVPPGFRNLFPQDYIGTQAAVLHDYLYNQRRVHGWSREYCDGIFLDAMESLGVPAWQRYAMYYAVRAGGWYPWGK